MIRICTTFNSIALVFILLICTVTNAYSQYKPGFSEEVYANDLSGALGFTFDKNGAMYVWTIDGRVIHVDPQTKQKTQLLDISAEVGRYDDFGLLGMTLDNNFLNNGRFYLYYAIKYSSVKWQGTYARVTRYEANKEDGFRSIKDNSRQILIGAPDPTNPNKGVPGDCIPLTANSHAGGGITMGADGSLLIPTGDGAAAVFDQGSNSESYYSQSIQNGFMTAAENIGSYRAQVDYSLSGKVLRINPDNGDGLPGNPDYNSGAPRSIKSRIYASGFRQPFRTSIRPNTGSTDINSGNPGALYMGDVGFTDWEEINVIKKGANYGWPLHEGMQASTRAYNKTEYKPAGVVFAKPAVTWRSGPGQINRNETLTDVKNTPGGLLPGYCVVGGGWHPGGGNYPAEYQNSYYFADFNGGWISKLAFDADNQPQPETMAKVLDGGSSYQYISCVAFNPVDKNMYYLRYPEGGGERVRRMIYNGGTGSPPVAIILADKTNGASPMTVQFTGNTSYDPEGKALTYAWDFGDNTTSTSANPAHTFTTSSSTSTAYTIKLTVTNSDGKTHQTEKVITVSSATNTAPVIASTSLDALEQMDLNVIKNINLSAVITDETPADQLSYKWTVSLFHNDHQHDDFITTSQTATASLPPIDCDGTLTYWYGVKLEVTDAGGLKTETVRYIFPNCAGNPQTITFNTISDRAPNAPPFTPEASASSGKPVVFYVIEGPAVIAEGKVFLTGRLGKVTIRTAQHGGDGYRPAKPVEKSFTVISDAADKQPPTVPTSLTISTITPNSMQLSWNAATDNVSIASYEVYQNNTKIGDVTSGTSYNVTGLTAGTEYYFFVRAVDPTGNVSANSNTATATTTGTSGPPANQPPTSPSIPPLTATVNVAYSSNPLLPFIDPDDDALTYTLTGLPTGLAFNATSRVITGTPTQANTYTLSYSATDNKNPAVSTTITLTVSPAGTTPPPVITGNFEGYLDGVYCHSISGWIWDRDNPNTPITVEFLAASGANPSIETATPIGSTLANTFRTDLQMAGKGNGAHGYNFMVPESIKNNQKQTIWGRVQGSAYVLMWSPKTLTCEGSGTPPPPPTNQPPAPPTVSPLTATVNVAYSSNPLLPFIDPDDDALTYTLTGLPTGLAFNATTRVITGTPTQVNTYNLIYAATDGQTKTDLTISLTVSPAGTPPPPPPPVITGNFEGYLDGVNCQSLSGWVFNYDNPNAPYTVEFLAASGANPSIETATPIGSTLANTFRTDLQVAGKGNGAHGYNFMVPESIKNNQKQTIWGRVQGAAYVLTGSPKTLTCEGSGTPPPPPTNQPPAPPTVSPLTATVNVAYSSAPLPAFTDTEPLTYALTGLPTGLAFNATTRVITGTPTQANTYTLSYSATDGQTKTDLTISLTVSPAGTPPPPVVVVTGNFEGYLDGVNCNSISGWVFNYDNPNAPYTVEFVENNTVIGSTLANIFRQDLKDAHKGNGAHGYVFNVPDSLKDGKTHSITGRVAGSTYNLIWSPKTFNCPNGGRQAATNPELISELLVSPNPTSGQVVISFRLPTQHSAQLQVVDVLGRVIWQRSVVGNAQLQEEYVDLSRGGSGLHIVQLKTSTEQISKRLIINK